MTTREAPPPHRRARDAARTHWIDADRRRAEQTQSMLGAKGGESGRTQDPDSVAFRALRWCRQHLLGTPKPIRDASVNDLMATHIASKYAVLESSPLTHPATSPDDTEPGPGHQELACGYLRALGIAAAWECVFDLLMTSIIVVASVVAGFAFHERGGSLTTAFFVGLTVFLVTRIPASPSIDSLRSIIGRICGLAVLAFLGYVAAPNLDRLGMTDGLHGSVVVVLPTAVFASIVTASLMTLLLVLRLLRDECVNRVLRANAQQILTLELVSTAEALATLATQQERIDWRPGSAVMTALSRLDTAGRLIERHVWFREGLRDVEKRKVATDMRRLSVEVLQLRGQLINAKRGYGLRPSGEGFQNGRVGPSRALRRAECPCHRQGRERCPKAASWTRPTGLGPAARTRARRRDLAVRPHRLRLARQPATAERHDGRRGFLRDVRRAAGAGSHNDRKGCVVQRLVGDLAELGPVEDRGRQGREAGCRTKRIAGTGQGSTARRSQHAPQDNH